MERNPASTAVLPENREKLQGSSDDAHRVRLTLTKHDYINAVYVNGYTQIDKFILAQTPLPSTLEDFISMVYENKCVCIVCLDEEHSTDKSVGQYLPPANKVSVIGHFQIACKSSNSTEGSVVRELKISRIGAVKLKFLSSPLAPPQEEQTVRHYQFKLWNSSDIVPSSVQSFISLIVDIEKSRHGRKRGQPILVHCLNGADRSGVFCVVSLLLEKFAVEQEVSVLNTVCQVRAKRRTAFQEIEHFRFCYACLTEMMENSKTDSYYNVLN